MPEDVRNLIDLVQSVESDIQKICSLLDARPELAGSLTVEDYFLVVDLARTVECHGFRS